MLASLVIPTRNRSATLARTLTALRHQRERDFEVVIADDGSDDDTRDVARRFEAELALRYLRRAHVGTAGARNAAMRVARGDVLIMCDDDRIADPDFVGDHVAAHAGAEPCVAGGRQRGIAAVWSRDAAYTATDLASLALRHPALVPRFAEPTAELVTEAMLRDDLAGTLAAFELPEPWWEGHATQVLATWGPELAGDRKSVV